MIVKQWKVQQDAAVLAFKSGKPVQAGKVLWFMHEEFLYCKLPSGRCLAYYKPSISNCKTSWGEEKKALHIWGEKVYEGKKIWCKQAVYGGLLVENIVQAIARDIMMHGALEAEKKGYPIILSIHDELLAEVEINFGSVEEFISIMCDIPKWAEGCPIKAEGWKGKRYKK